MAKAGDIPKYMTNAFYDMFGHYQMTKKLQNPNGTIGYANESLGFVYAFMAFEQEESSIQEEERVKREQESKAKQHSSKARKSGRMSGRRH